MQRELIAYIKGLTVTQGRRAGERFRLLPWQSKFIRGAFADDSVHTAALSIARGNGKTTLIAGIAAAMVDSILAVPRGETVIVASSFEQARIAFEHIRAFLGDKLEDRTWWRVWDTAQQARIENRVTGARVRCIGSDPRRAHGLAPVLVIADEPAQWSTNQGEQMVSAMLTASGKQPHSRFIALGTRPQAATHWFSIWLQGGADYSQSHAARPQDRPRRFQRRTWKRANPSMAHMPDLAAAIRREATAARKDASMLAAFDALRLNLGTPDTVQSTILDSDTWAEIEGVAELAGACVWGVDLGTSAAQSAIAAFWPLSGALRVLAAFPSIPSLSERGLRDGVGTLYEQCAARDELITVGGAAVSVAELVREGVMRFGAPAAIAADRWREAELRDALALANVPAAALHLRGMGYKDGADDVRLFRRACLEGKVTPLPSLLLTAAMSEARAVMDTSGNAKLAKSTEGGRRVLARDDAAAAAILAVATGIRRAAAPSGGYIGLI